MRIEVRQPTLFDNDEVEIEIDKDFIGQLFSIYIQMREGIQQRRPITEFNFVFDKPKFKLKVKVKL
jgi:hypothetical protein